jgi:hypothetical protein
MKNREATLADVLAVANNLYSWFDFMFINLPLDLDCSAHIKREVAQSETKVVLVAHRKLT